MSQIIQVTRNLPLIYSQYGGMYNAYALTLLDDGEMGISAVPLINTISSALDLYHGLSAGNYKISASYQLDNQGDVVGIFVNLWVDQGIHLPCFALSDTFTRPLGNITEGLINRCMISNPVDEELLVLYQFPYSTSPVWVDDYIQKIGNIPSDNLASVSHIVNTEYNGDVNQAMHYRILEAIRSREYNDITLDVIVGDPAESEFRAAEFIKHAEQFFYLARATKTNSIFGQSH